MKKGIACIFISLFLFFSFYSVSDANYDFFGGFIPEGTPAIDGVISSGEWNTSGQITLYKFFGEDSKIEIYLMWDSTYLYLGAQIEDFELWVDNYNPSAPWESTWDDDAFKWEIDPDFSRDEYMQSNDRVFAMNANGSATRFDKGDGAGGTQGVAPISILKAAVIDGILNDYTFKTLVSESQKDKGFVVEIAISWKDIFGSSASVAPGDGYSLGMNFTNIEDDTGGTLDAGYYNEWKRVFDEITRFMGEEGCPENWAEFVISSRNDTTPPAAVSGLTTSNTNAFSTRISFTATGDNGSSGYAKSYQIRYSQSAITTANWSSATEYKNNFRPQKAGKQESFKIIGLSPNTKYYIGIKAVDERGNASSIATASFTTTAAEGSEDKGFLAVDPGQRYFAWEKGDPLVVIGDNQGIGWPGIRCFYNGPMWSDSLWQNINWYNVEGIQDGRDYLKYLSDHGVNTIRIFAEDMQPYNPVYLFTDVSAGPNNIVFNQNTLDFLETLLDECAKVNINVILSPFDTFHYSEVFSNPPLVPSMWAKVPFSTAKGGPMATQEDFFEASNIEYIKAVIKKLVDTLGDRKNLLAWEIVNEFDSDEPWIGWNRATAAKREQTVNALEEYIRTIDPDHMVFISSVRWDPKFNDHRITTPNTIVMGPDPALVLNNNHFDFSSTHMYYHDIRDPSLNNPDHRTAPDGSFTYKIEVTDQDKTIAPSVRMKQGVQFYYANSLTPKPYACTEYGPIQFFTTKYDEYFTEEQDNQMFHNAMWTYLATGEVGTGLRWPGEMMADHMLTDQMRDYQLAFKHFIDAGNLDFSVFQPVPIGQYLLISNTALPIIKTGITDGKQGVIFLTNDERKQTNGTISGARLTVPKLTPYSQYTFEFWDSYDETKTACTSSVSATSNGSGNAVINLPDIVRTQVIKFFYTGSAGVDGGVVATDDLWIKAILKPTWMDHVTLRWYKGGEDVTSTGDKVVWGYFYADPSDFPYGSTDNPEVFVKIYIASTGWKNIAFNHVTVDDVDIFSSYQYDGTPDQQGTITLGNRVGTHTYDVIGGARLAPPEPSPVLGNGSAIDGGYVATSDLWIKTVLKPTWMSWITMRWVKGGESVSSTGDTSVWGYFYADPGDFPYGSANNPEVFVKIYLASNGWKNIAFNHVTADDVDVYSAYSYAGSADQSGLISTSNRVAQHSYD